jgi:pyruvate kinase
MPKIRRLRRTKIVATLGPATDNSNILEELILAGMNVARLNFSHGKPEDHKKRAADVLRLSKKNNKHVAILVDLQGPKIRIAQFIKGSVTLQEGQQFVIDVELDPNAGNETQVGCVYKDLATDVKPGNKLLLDDGRIILEVSEVNASKIVCVVIIGGTLSNNKGINLQGGGLSAAALTEQDIEHIQTAADINADYIAVSFPRNAADMQYARKVAEEAGSKAGIIAKIERAEVLDVIEEVIEASDAIMVARGDLGVEIGDAALPPVQKKLISKAREMNTAVITATQMMESMIESPIPTRAEVFDVANAVADGTDAVMLSAETSVGKYPLNTIEAVHRICLETEKQRSVRSSNHRIGNRFARLDESIAMSAMYIANHTNIRAIATYTESGSTAMRMSRISSGIPIIAMAPYHDVCRKLMLYRGVNPLLLARPEQVDIDINLAAIDKLRGRKIVQAGDLVIITTGEVIGDIGGTNSLKIVEVPD